MKETRGASYRIALSGLLLAVMLVLGFLESLLPSFGIPGIRLGLSNSVLIFSIYVLGIPNAYILMVLKVLLSGFLFGGVSAMIYAFAGGLLSLTVMILLHKLPKIPLVAVSMAGGLFHNVGQVAVAMVIFHTPVQMLYYLAVLCAAGLVCGLLTGLAAGGAMRYLTKIRNLSVPANPVADRVLIAAALVLIAAGIVLTIGTMKQSLPAQVQQTETVPSMMTEEELKQMLTQAGSSSLPVLTENP